MFITIYERIKAEQQKIEHQISSIQSEINSLPEGKLQCQQNGKYYKWYCSNGHDRFYIPKNNQKLVQQLSIKDYLTQQSNNLSDEQAALKQYLDNYNSKQNSTDSSLAANPLYQEYISSYLCSKTNGLMQWANEPYDHNPKHPEHLIHKTNCGYFVRSKSEAIISMLLHNNNIPFRYECALNLNEFTVYPDFTIRHPQTGKFYYWEHFGKMNDPRYVKTTLSKLELYITNDIFPSINLITTYETKNNPLDIEMVENIIQYYFL